MISVYCVTNLVNGEQYVGWASDIQRRWNEHRRCGKACSLLLRRAIKKYGAEQFQFGVLEKFKTEKEAKKKEIEYISWLDTFENGYNLTQGGEGNLGWQPSKDTRHNMSTAALGKVKHYQKVTVDGIEYSSIKKAAEALNIGDQGLVSKLSRQRKHEFTKFTLTPIYEDKRTEITRDTSNLDKPVTAEASETRCIC